MTVPASSNVCEYVAPCLSVGEVNDPSSATTWCDTALESLFVHFTVWPTLAVTDLGTNWMFFIEIGTVPAAAAGAAVLVAGGAAAGALVGPGKKIPAGVLVAGVPGRIVRDLTDDDRAAFARTPDRYMAKALRHRAASEL